MYNIHVYRLRRGECVAARYNIFIYNNNNTLLLLLLLLWGEGGCKSLGRIPRLRSHDDECTYNV